MSEGDDSLPLLYLPVQTELYSHSKALADRLVLEANSNEGGMMTASIRPSGIFGEGDATTKAFADNAAAGKLKFQVVSHIPKNYSPIRLINELRHCFKTK